MSKLFDATPSNPCRISLEAIGSYQRGATFAAVDPSDIGAPLRGNVRVILMDTGFGGNVAIEAGRSERAYRDKYQAVATVRWRNGSPFTAYVFAASANASVNHEAALGALSAELEAQGFNTLSAFAWDGAPFTLTEGSESAEDKRNRNVHNAARKAKAMDIHEMARRING